MYYAPKGGLPSQNDMLTGAAIFTDAYAVIPKGVMTDIVTSNLPFWDKTRAWIIARPMSGFSETFAQYIVEVSPGGGSTQPEPDANAEAVLFVVSGAIELTLDGTAHNMEDGGYAFIPPRAAWSVKNTSDAPATFHWVRKSYEAVEGIDYPRSLRDQ